MWDATFGSTLYFDNALQISLKRAKIGIQILRKNSDEKAKFDLFQRLNSHSAVAEPQELRNCIMVMRNDRVYKFMRDLSNYESFKKIMSQTSRSVEEQGLMDYVTRYLVFSFVEYDKKLDIEEYLTNGLEEIVEEIQRNTNKIEKAFKGSFDLLVSSIGEGALRKYDGSNFKGRVGQTAFEVIALGIAYNFESINKKSNPDTFIKNKIKNFWNTTEADEFSQAGLRGTQRIQKTIPFGREWFK
jgi:hypothetical protein